MQLLSPQSWSPLRVLAAFVLLGLAIPSLYYWNWPHYTSDFVYTFVVNEGAEAESPNELAQIARNAILNDTAIASIVAEYDLYPEQHAGDALNEIRSSISTRHVGTHEDGTLQHFVGIVSFRHSDKETSRRVALNLQDRLTAAAEHIGTTTPGLLDQGYAMSVIDPPAIPSRADFHPEPFGLGLFLGTALGSLSAGLLWVLRRFRAKRGSLLPAIRPEDGLTQS